MSSKGVEMKTFKNTNLGFAEPDNKVFVNAHKVIG